MMTADDAGDSFFGTIGTNREVLLWAVATRRQMERWEAIAARWVAGQFGMAEPSDSPGIWQAQIEHHLALVSART
jgi:hypothetical protein